MAGLRTTVSGLALLACVAGFTHAALAQVAEEPAHRKTIIPNGITVATPLPQVTEHTGMMVSGVIAKYHPKSDGGIGGLEVEASSNFPKPDEVGLHFHTHLRYMLPSSDQIPSPPTRQGIFENLQHFSTGERPNGAPGIAAGINTPSSVACVYHLVDQPAGQPGGCNPNTTTANPAGGVGAIAVVDAYDDATAAADLSYFSNQFGLPAADLTVVYANNTQPASDHDWNVEESLDLQWAHAMAPNAKLFLVEAADNSGTNLFNAVQVAQQLVDQNGGGEVSMSFGSPEDPTETSADVIFSGAPADVINIASAGDVGSVQQYPAESPNVIGVGGTSLPRDTNDNLTSEVAWSDSGGGISAYETRPVFQDGAQVHDVVGNSRGAPDVSMLADPNTGVWVYLAGDWYTAGGTSLSAPLTAGVLNLRATTDGLPTNFATEIQTLYTNALNATESRDVTSGSCGANSATVAYDLCTGTGVLLNTGTTSGGGGGGSNPLPIPTPTPNPGSGPIPTCGRVGLPCAPSGGPQGLPTLPREGGSQGLPHLPNGVEHPL